MTDAVATSGVTPPEAPLRTETFDGYRHWLPERAAYHVSVAHINPAMNRSMVFLDARHAYLYAADAVISMRRLMGMSAEDAIIVTSAVTAMDLTSLIAWFHNALDMVDSGMTYRRRVEVAQTQLYKAPS